LSSSYSALAVRRSCLGRRASAFNACTTRSWNGLNFVAPASRRYCGSSTFFTRRYLRTVLRDKLVARTISRTDFFSRKCIHRTLPVMAMVITSCIPPLRKKAARVG